MGVVEWKIARITIKESGMGRTSEGVSSGQQQRCQSAATSKIQSFLVSIHSPRLFAFLFILFFFSVSENRLMMSTVSILISFVH
jgi:hypothetical protein